MGLAEAGTAVSVGGVVRAAKAGHLHRRAEVEATASAETTGMGAGLIGRADASQEVVETTGSETSEVIKVREETAVLAVTPRRSLASKGSWRRSEPSDKGGRRAKLLPARAPSRQKRIARAGGAGDGRMKRRPPRMVRRSRKPKKRMRATATGPWRRERQSPVKKRTRR